MLEKKLKKFSKDKTCLLQSNTQHNNTKQILKTVLQLAKCIKMYKIM